MLTLFLNVPFALFFVVTLFILYALSPPFYENLSCKQKRCDNIGHLNFNRLVCRFHPFMWQPAAKICLNCEYEHACRF